jgi:hypothetical protein
VIKTGFLIRTHFMRIRIQGLKNLRVRIRIQRVKNLRIWIDSFIFAKK